MLEVGGGTPGVQFDQLAVSSGRAATLDGTLAVRFINRFVPALGDAVPVVTFGSATGTG